MPRPTRPSVVVVVVDVDVVVCNSGSSHPPVRVLQELGTGSALAKSVVAVVVAVPEETHGDQEEWVGVPNVAPIGWWLVVPQQEEEEKIHAHALGLEVKEVAEKEKELFDPPLPLIRIPRATWKAWNCGWRPEWQNREWW